MYQSKKAKYLVSPPPVSVLMAAPQFARASSLKLAPALAALSQEVSRISLAEAIAPLAPF